MGDEADEEVAVLLLVDAHVVAGALRGGRRRAVDQLALQVLGLQHVAELLRTPVRDQELDPGPGAQPAVAVVAEDAADARPDLGDLLARHPGTQPLGQHRVGGQTAADPQVEAGAVLGVLDADEGDVVDLGDDVLQRVTGDGGLELARQVGVLRVADVALDDVGDGRRRVDDLVGGDAGDRGAEDDPRAVTAGLGGGQADSLQPAPDLRHVLDPDPVQLDVLPVGDVGGVPAEVHADLADHPQLLAGQRAAVDPDAEHEVLVVQLVRLEGGGLAAVDARLALGVEPVPAEPTAQVTRVDAGEAALGVDVLDPGADVERVVVLLGLLVGVEGFAVAEGPLAFAAWLAGARSGRTCGAGGGGLGHRVLGRGGGRRG